MNSLDSATIVLQKSNRRNFLKRSAAALSVVVTSNSAWAATPLRFASTAVFLNDQIALLDRWQSYLQVSTGRAVRFIQRGSYREIVDLLLNDSVDVAWLCGYPLMLHEDRLAALAVPRYQGAALYRSHLIVPNTDTSTQNILDLKGKVFAFSDPLSNSGYLVPRTQIVLGNQSPSTFFRRSFFTFSHRKVVDAVRAGLADAGAVDGYVWDTMAAQFPSSVAGLRVAWKSAPHGFPPIVARRNWDAKEARQLVDALLGMQASNDGRSLLQRLNIDGFEVPKAKQFDSIRTMLALSAQSTS